MKNWKLGLIAVFAFTVMLFSGCSSDEPPVVPQVTQPQATATPTPAPPPAVIETPEEIAGAFAGRTLELGIWRGNDTEFAAIELVRESFEAQTGATITWRLYTDFGTQIIADLAAGVAPDAFYVESMMAEFLINEGVLMPLDSAQFNIGAFYPGVVEAFSVGGRTYALPKDQSVLARYVNVDLLEQVGFTLADIPASAEEYLEFLPRLQAALDAEFGTNVVMAASGNFEPARILHWAGMGGAQPVLNGRSNWSSPQVVSNVEFIMSLYNTGAMRTPAQMGRGWNGEAFGTGSMVIMEEGNWVYSWLHNYAPEINFVVLDMPTFQGQSAGMSFTVGWGIYAYSDNQDLAAAWLNYKNGPDGMYVWTVNAGPLPTRSDVATRMAPNMSSNLNVHLDQLPYATPWSMGLFGPVINDAFNNYAPLILDGHMTVAAALAAIDTQANFEIDFAN